MKGEKHWGLTPMVRRSFVRGESSGMETLGSECARAGGLGRLAARQDFHFSTAWLTALVTRFLV